MSLITKIILEKYFNRFGSRDYFLNGLLGVLVGFIFRLSSSSFFFLLCLCMRRDKELLVVQNFAVEKDFR